MTEKHTTMFFFVVIMFIASSNGFLLDNINTQSPGGQSAAKYITLSEFYDTKTKLQNGIDQTRSETRDLRLDMDNKMSLLTSQLQQMFSAFQQQVTNNGILNENKTFETLELQYNELLAKHAKLQDNFESLQKKYFQQEKDLFALKNATGKNSLDIAEVKRMKTVSQTFDLNAMQQKMDSLSSQTQALQVHEQARNQDFQALYNLTVTSGNRLNEIARNQTWTNIDIYNRFKNAEAIQNSTFDSITKNLKMSENHQNEAIKAINQTMKTTLDVQTTAFNSKLTELDNRFNVSLAVVKQTIAKNSEQVALTACVKTDYGKQHVGHILKFDDIRTQRNISNISSFKSGGKFICQSDGLYLVSAWVISHLSGSEFSVMKNGNIVANGYITSYQGHAFSANAVVAVGLQINDTVWIQVQSQLYAYSNRMSCVTIIKIK